MDPEEEAEQNDGDVVRRLEKLVTVISSMYILVDYKRRVSDIRT